MINMLLRDEIDPETHILVDYYLEAKNEPGLRATLGEVIWELAIGQSIGNPSIRNDHETKEMFERHACKISKIRHHSKKCKCGSKRDNGCVRIGFPIENFDLEKDGITQLLVCIMGGQLDINKIERCHIYDISFPSKFVDQFKDPKYGIEGIRKFVNVQDKPLLGGIVKPKTGMSLEQLLDIVKMMVDGGVDFIKEDEVLSNPACCPFEKRVELISNYLNTLDRKVIFAHCVNADYPYVIDRVKKVHELGGNAVHVNFWAGFSVYRAIRELDLPLFLFFQKSGDKILTDVYHRFYIGWSTICEFIGLMGCDFAHAGMSVGGYMSQTESELEEVLETLRRWKVMPSLSCGFHPGLVESTTQQWGIDYMANVGGAIHGHPGGTLSGTKAMRQAIDGAAGPEYKQAIDKWGLI